MAGADLVRRQAEAASGWGKKNKKERTPPPLEGSGREADQGRGEEVSFSASSPPTPSPAALAQTLFDRLRAATSDGVGITRESYGTGKSAPSTSWRRKPARGAWPANATPVRIW